MTIDPEKKKKMMSQRWIVFAVLALAYFFVYFHRVSGPGVEEAIKVAFGDDIGPQLGLLASAYLYAYTIMQLPSGVLTDTLGPRKASTIFVFLIAIGAILSSAAIWSHVFVLMIVGKFIIGVGAAVVYIPIMKVLAMWFRKSEFATMSGVLLLIGNFGGLCATAPMLAMIGALGLANTYVALAVITVVIAVLCWIFIVDHPTHKGFPAIEEVEAEETGKPITESSSAKIPMMQAVKEIFTSGRKFWPMAIWFFFMYGTIMLWQAFSMGSVMKATVPEGTDLSLALMCPGIGFCIGCFLAGILADKVFHSKKKVLVIGTFVYTLVWAWIAFATPNDAMVWCALNICFGFFGGWFVVSYGQIKELYPLAVAGMSSASINLFPFLGGAILTTIAPFLKVAGATGVGVFSTILTSAVVMMVIALVCAIFTVEKAKD